MKARVLVRLNDTVMDKAGQVVCQRLAEAGFAEVRQARVGKLIELDIDSGDEENAKARVDQMCKRVLMNASYEEYDLILINE